MLREVVPRTTTKHDELLLANKLYKRFQYSKSVRL